MTQPEQAVLLWPVLALAARNQQILSYSDVQGFTGIAQHGLGQPLGLIHHYCERQRFPRLNVIVVNRDTGLPGEGLPGKGMTPGEIFELPALGLVSHTLRNKVPLPANRFEDFIPGHWLRMSYGPPSYSAVSTLFLKCATID
jgi:hypothetical protein